MPDETPNAPIPVSGAERLTLSAELMRSGGLPSGAIGTGTIVCFADDGAGPSWPHPNPHLCFADDAE